MIHVLRLGHRKERDKRISTHIGLVARAFLAEKIVYTGEYDENLFNSLNKVSKEWGGKFETEYSKDYRKTINFYKKQGFTLVHLTMYGTKLNDAVKKISTEKNLLIIVGGEKVPADVYKNSNYNISITSQPHSEVAALAIVLDRIKKGEELEHEFKKAKKRIKPNPCGKTFF